MLNCIIKSSSANSLTHTHTHTHPHTLWTWLTKMYARPVWHSQYSHRSENHCKKCVFVSYHARLVSSSVYHHIPERLRPSVTLTCAWFGVAKSWSACGTMNDRLQRLQQICTFEKARRWNIRIIYAEIWGIVAFILDIYLEYVTHSAALSLRENEGGFSRKLLWIVCCSCGFVRVCQKFVQVVKSSLWLVPFR